MKKRKIKIISCLLIGTFLLSGCGQSVTMVEMSEQQSMQVTEYAAGLLLQNALNYETKLIDTDLAIEKLAKEREEKRILDEKINAMKMAQKKEEVKTEEPVDDTEVVDVSSGDRYSFDIEALLELSDVSVTYSGAEIVDSYPEDGSFVFAMDATTGNKLLVVHFDVANLSGEEKWVDLTQLGCRFRLSVNGGEYRPTLATLLLNDLSQFQNTLEAGAVKDTVLVVEIPDGQGVESMVLNVKKGNEHVKMHLQ